MEDVIDVYQLPTWQQSEPPDYQIQGNALDALERRILYRDDINAKISLWSGDIACLNADAIVCTSNEALTDRSNKSVFATAGANLDKDLRALKPCRTGDAKIAKGYKLPARYVIFTVGPRYNLRYKTAAESALFSAYRSVLQLTREKKISTLGLAVINTTLRGYPAVEGAHIAIRTVRRFLEKHLDKIDRVVFCANGQDWEIYDQLLPLYFPRDGEEETYAAVHLPINIGSAESGEPVIADRKIRISQNPGTEDSGDEDGVGDRETAARSLSLNDMESSAKIGQHEFAKMKEDIDNLKQKHRRTRQVSLTDQAMEREKRYERLLRRARQEDFADIVALRCMYQTGVDRFGRPVIVFIGKHFPAAAMDTNRTLLYFINLMDSIVSKDYLVIYFHTLTTNENHMQMNFLRTAFSVASQKYVDNLRAFYIVHATLWTRMMVWFYTTFYLSPFKERVKSLTGVEHLHSFMSPDQLDIPSFILAYDFKTNGTNYFTVPLDPCTEL